MSQLTFRKYQPLSLRLWHWANAIVILGLLATVLIRKTFLSWRTNALVIEEKLKATGVTITPELAKEIAVAIRQPLWDWHIILGYGLSFLIIARVLIAIFGERECPGLSAVKRALKVWSLPPVERSHELHFTVVKMGYAVFYLVTLFMVLSGLLLTFKAELGISKDLANLTKEVHELTMWFFVVFISGHLMGVVFAETRNDKGIVSDMIHGGS